MCIANNIGDIGAQSIGDSLTLLTLLTSLQLSCELSLALLSMLHLVQLNYGSAANKIQHIGAQSIGNGIKSLTTLTALDLSGQCSLTCDV